MSVAVTVPTSVSPSSITNVEEDVNTGTVVSTTLTVLEAVPSLPEASVEVYVIVCVVEMAQSITTNN